MLEKVEIKQINLWKNMSSIVALSKSACSRSTDSGTQGEHAYYIINDNGNYSNVV